MKIEVLYEDNDILVAVKPYGLPSQPDKKNSENMVSMLKLRIFEKEHRTEEPYLAPIHRLDRPVGGIMLFAKNKEAASKLSKQSEDGEMVKYYQAILSQAEPIRSVYRWLVKKLESGAIQSIIQSSRKQRNLISRSVCMHPDWNSSIR